MKKGLTYISERTGQLRYADDAGNEQWVQQTSTYIPLVEIKRGQPVSIATIDDLKIVAGDNTALFEALKNSSDTYIVLTNPSRHVSTVGLALEYTKGEVKLEGGELVTSEKIHIIGQGLYVEDIDYVGQAFTEVDNFDVSKEEYWPEFFNDYENSIGKKIYVKGECDGQLTLVKEEAYLAYNQVIVVGFVSDANIKEGDNIVNHGAIEVQMMGDDRGAVDATMFEAILGEDVYIGKDAIQINGETNSQTKVFALGCDDDETFEFSFNFFRNEDKKLPRGFIAIQRIDGATAYVCVNGSITEDDVIDTESFTARDRAFVQVARYYAAASGNTNTFLGELDFDGNRKVGPATNLADVLSAAFAAVSRGETVSLKDKQTHNPNKLDMLSTQEGVYRLRANDVGGSYEVYVSENLSDYVTGLYIASRGANYNKGYAVLADIRNKNRQNIIGIYNSGHTGLITQGTRAIFLKQGLFTDNTNPYEVGATYYLGSHGNIFLVPQEFYNSIVQIGYAQSEDKLIVDCCDSRQYNNGDLPVGYMKPSIKGEPEFGFWLMDGKTPHKVSDAETLIVRLKEFYDVGELQIKSYNFGTSAEPDYAEGFIIPEVKYKSHYSDENTTGYVAAQIKWLASAVYKEMPRTPFVRRTGVISNFVKDGKEYNRAVLPDFDITSIMIYGPDEDRMQVPDLETLDIKLFVDLDKNGNSRNWTQLEPGFHTTNNFTYYGFKWTVVQTRTVDASHPYGEYALRAVYSGTETEDSEVVDTNVLGVCYQADPFAPPVSLAGYDVKILVTKHDYYSRQFDVESLFKDYVKESVVDVSGNPWQNNAVSGQAVRNDIKFRVYTNDLDISDENEKAGTVDAYVKHIYLTSEKGTFENAQDRNKYFNDRLIQSDLRLKNPNGTDVWNIDYVEGVLEYSTSDVNSGDIGLESKISNHNYALLPYFMFKNHRDALVIDETYLTEIGANDRTEYPHGIKNTGYTGTINARQLQGANLGYGEYIFSQNAGDTRTQEDSGVTSGSSDITIPYIQRFNHKYITRLGNVIKQYEGVNLISTEEKNIGDGVITEKTTFGPTVVKSYRKDFGGIATKYDYEHNTIEFLLGDSDTQFVDLKANSVIPSSIQYKYLLHSFANKNADTTFITSALSPKDKRNEFTENLDEALQAIYEMPLATFMYNRQYESGDEHYKRFFGMIVEQLANTSAKFKADEVDNETTVDNLKYVYTEAERESIAEYLNLIMDDKNAGINTSTAVGILLKAAKETQERLLNLEVATYGKDSPTLPGADNVNENYKETQKSTIAGLNRLVKALCREVFQDADPTSIDELGAWSVDGESYSRLDMLDKEVNGESAKDDDGTRIALADVSSYPDDASVTQEVELTHHAVPDADKDNDFDDDSYLDTVTYTEVDSTSDAFDGLNDAVNRIVAKLNQLTIDVKGTDEIKNRPLKLDYIRQTLETILREVYDDGANAADIEDGAYKKTNVSRIDRIVEELYNFDLDVGPTKVQKTNTYNGKVLKGNKSELAADETTYDTFAATSPESLADLKDTASIIDVIIELLTGDEKALTRTDAVDWSDRAKNSTGYKVAVTDEDGNGVTYNPSAEEHLANNELYNNNKSVVARLNDIEKALELISLKVQNKLDFNDLATRNNSTPYARVTSIDDFFNNIASLFNITFEADGFYNTERTASVKAEDLKNIVNGVENKQADLKLYDIIYDAVKRIKNNEWALKYNDVVLGSDYNDYEDTGYTKDTYETLTESAPTYTKDYTVTSDMKAVLKLLWGGDITEDDSSNKTQYTHFLTANESGDNFAKSPLGTSGVSVLDELYRHLYNVPTVRSANAKTVLTASNVDYDSMSGYANLKYDPDAPRSTTASLDTVNTSLLGRGRRAKFIAQAGTDAPLSRIDILENVVKALYRYIGMGSNEDTHYYDGQFTFSELDNSAVPSELWGSSDTSNDTTNNGAIVSINGNENYDVHSRYHELAAVTDYKLSAIALQAYYNTIDLADLLTNKDSNGKKVAAKYVKAARASITAHTPKAKAESGKTTVSVNSYLEAYDSYSIFASIQKALNFTDKLDDELMKLRRDFIEDTDFDKNNIGDIWAVLGDDYAVDTNPAKGTVSTRLTTLETEVGTDDSKGSLFSRVATNEDDISDLRSELGDTGATAETVYTRIKTLEDNQAAVKAAINNVDNTSATVDKQYGKSDNYFPGDTVFKTVKSSTNANDDPNDDLIEPAKNVLATKASVEDLVKDAVKELQLEMRTAIQNNRKLAALMAYMKCDGIVASEKGVKFERSGKEIPGLYDMQESNLVFGPGEGKTGEIGIASLPETYCGESMIELTLNDWVDHLKFKCMVPYDAKIEGSASYENQTFKYGAGNYATSLDDDTYTIVIH